MQWAQLDPLPSLVRSQPQEPSSQLCFKSKRRSVEEWDSITLRPVKNSRTSYTFLTNTHSPLGRYLHHPKSWVLTVFSFLLCPFLSCWPPLYCCILGLPSICTSCTCVIIWEYDSQSYKQSFLPSESLRECCGSNSAREDPSSYAGSSWPSLPWPHSSSLDMRLF